VNGNECVGGVEADTNDVDFGDGHLPGPNVKELPRDAKRNAATGRPWIARLIWTLAAKHIGDAFCAGLTWNTPQSHRD
jgi:hypothetical protein